MDILLLAPQPFYQDRGTPIAVALLLKGLSERGDHVEVLTYHEGKDVYYEHVTLHRICNLRLIRDIPPGFSWKKVVCDLVMFGKAFHLVARHRYDLVHAVEESVFIALLLKWIFKIPYVYDMDSSLAQQMIEKFAFLNHCVVFLKFCERLAVKNATVVIPVCEALAHYIKEHQPNKVEVIPDVSLISGVPPLK